MPRLIAAAVTSGLLFVVARPGGELSAQAVGEAQRQPDVSNPSRSVDGPPPPIPPATASRDTEGHVTVRAVRLEEPLRLDGDLTEALYETVPPITGFFQLVPDEGARATERTEVWVFYDETDVYVSARLWDSAPESEWVANEMRRNTNQLRQNDNFGVMLDTFYDRRNGYFFYTNPLGARAERYYTDETSSNSDLLPVWDVRSGRFDGGWTLEIQIPFRSLRYRPGESQVWGIQMRRGIRRKNEWVYLAPLPLSATRGGSGSAGIFRISYAGTLVGIEAPPAGRNVDVMPYGIYSLATDRVADPPFSNRRDVDAGLDVKYAITENLTADLTYNTDFAQVEVDERQVNLTRFPLLFPEKRQFFQEGRGIFDFGGLVGGNSGPGGGGTPILFFSRRIGLEGGRPVPIQGGARVTGEIGRFSLGALGIRTDGVASAGVPSANFGVVRMKSDVLARSRVGALFTRRSASTLRDGASETYGVDAAFSFLDDIDFGGYWARTRTPGLQGDDASYEAQVSYSPDLYGFQASHLVVGDHFNPEVGFLRRDDFRRTFASAYFSPRPASIRWIRQLIWQASLNRFENGDGVLETRELVAGFGTEFETSDVLSFEVSRAYELLDEPFAIDPDATIPPGEYEFTSAKASLLLGGQRRFNGVLEAQRGAFYDGHIQSVGLSSGRLEVLRQLSLEPGASVNWVDLPGGSFTSAVLLARASYSFSPRMFLTGLFQYSSSAEALGTNLRFRWEYRPGSELFVVYTDERDTTGPRAPTLANRALVIKVNNLLRF